MNVSDFDFALPDELVAQQPSPARGGSRLMVLSRSSGTVTHSAFDRLDDFLLPGDLLVVNDTRVFPARLLGQREPSGGAVECLLLRQLPTPNSTTPKAPDRGPWELGIESWELWEALMHPGQKLHPGARVAFERDGVRIDGEVLAQHFHGRRTIRLWTAGIPLEQAIERVGHIPLPPYIKREDQDFDRDRYQTIYAREPGSIAAPTAGLHFTAGLLERLAARGVERVEVTLHVGYGTFKPVRTDRVEDHAVDPETFVVTPAAAGAINRARRARRRIIAVGTTTARTLESLELNTGGEVTPATGETRLFIHPGHQFCVIDGLITNFHLPRSSLLMLVAAFAGRDAVIGAYQEAVRQRYRFYSYGDAMLIV